MKWEKSNLRWFNGSVCTAVCQDGSEVGIFREKYPIAGMYWSVRFRNEPGCWGGAIPFTTKKEAKAFAERGEQ